MQVTIYSNASRTSARRLRPSKGAPKSSRVLVVSVLLNVEEGELSNETVAAVASGIVEVVVVAVGGGVRVTVGVGVAVGVDDRESRLASALARSALSHSISRLSVARACSKHVREAHR